MSSDLAKRLQRIQVGMANEDEDAVLAAIARIEALEGEIELVRAERHRAQTACEQIAIRFRDAQARAERLRVALSELEKRTENFWAFIQGEYGVRISSNDHEDHNVSEFFAAMRAAHQTLEDDKQ